MSCNGPCEQGRRACPHPEACEQFDGVHLREVLCSLLWLVGCCALLVIVVKGWPWW